MNAQRSISAANHVENNEAWRSDFTARVDKLGYIVNYHLGSGEVRILQFGNILAILAKDADTAVTWLLNEERERRERQREAEAIGRSQPVITSRALSAPVTREEFDACLSQ